MINRAILLLIIMIQLFLHAEGEYFMLTNKDETYQGHKLISGMNTYDETYDLAKESCFKFYDSSSVLMSLDASSHYLRVVQIPLEDITDHSDDHSHFEVLHRVKHNPDMPTLNISLSNAIILEKRLELSDPKTIDYLVRSGANHIFLMHELVFYAISNGYEDLAKYIVETYIPLNQRSSSLNRIRSESSYEAIVSDLGFDNLILWSEPEESFDSDITFARVANLYNLTDLCKYFYIQSGVTDTSITGQMAIFSLRNSNMELVNLFRSEGVDIGGILERAVIKPSIEVIELILSNISPGADTGLTNEDIEDSIIHAINLEEESIYRYIITNTRIITLSSNHVLYMACLQGDIAAVKYLIESGYYINKYSGELVRTAVMGGNLDVVNHLMQHSFYLQEDVDEALRLAKRKGFGLIAEVLESHGAQRKLGLIGVADSLYDYFGTIL